MWVAQNALETSNPRPGENQVRFIELGSVRILFQIIMARHRVSDNLRWQIIGMRNAGLGCRAIGSHINRHQV